MFYANGGSRIVSFVKSDADYVYFIPADTGVGDGWGYVEKCHRLSFYGMYKEVELGTPYPVLGCSGMTQTWKCDAVTGVFRRELAVT